jgi:hypothetical protein
MPKNTAIIAQTPVERRLKWVSPKYRPGYLKALAGKASPSQAIKAMCLQCMGYCSESVVQCQSAACPLYAYRPTFDRKDEDDAREDGKLG